MSICVYLIHYNSTLMMEYQVTLLRKFIILNDGTELKIFGTVDSDDQRIRQQMREKWLSLGVFPIEMPTPRMGGTHKHFGVPYGLAFDYVFKNYVRKNTFISLVLENDVMPVDYIDLEDYSRGYQVCGDIRFYTSLMPVRLSMFWIGLLIFNHQIFEDSDMFDGRDQQVKIGNKYYPSDCGGGTYYWLSKHKDDVRHILTVGGPKEYDPFDDEVCVVHNITDDKHNLPPNIDQSDYDPIYRIVNYENKFVHLERMNIDHAYKGKNEKANWFKRVHEKLLKC